MSQPDLMRAFDFTATDLEANRRGLMTDSQKHKLRQKRLAEIVLIGLFTLYFATGWLSFQYNIRIDHMKELDK
jgi:hypothetical protein